MTLDFKDTSKKTFHVKGKHYDLSSSSFSVRFVFRYITKGINPDSLVLKSKVELSFQW